MSRTIKFLLFLICVSHMPKASVAQTTTWTEQLQVFDSLYNNAEFDSALVQAKKMCASALEMESDTSLHYAVSFRKMGLCHADLQQPDSAQQMYEKSMSVLADQKRQKTADYADCLYNLGGVFRYRRLQNS